MSQVTGARGISEEMRDNIWDVDLWHQEGSLGGKMMWYDILSFFSTNLPLT